MNISLNKILQKSNIKEKETNIFFQVHLINNLFRFKNIIQCLNQNGKQI